MASVVRPRRPPSVTTLAVLQLVVGVVGLIYEILKAGASLMFLAAPALMKAAADANPAVAITAQVPYFFEVQLTASLVGLVLSILLIADGIGLLQLRRWAYNLGVLYGWLSIAYQAAWMGYVILIAQPVMLAGFENTPVPPAVAKDPESYRNIMKGATIFDTATTGLGLAYPIFVLIMLAFARKAFRRPESAPEGAEDFGAGEAPPPPAGEGLPPGYGGEADDRISPG